MISLTLLRQIRIMLIMGFKRNTRIYKKKIPRDKS